MKSRIVALSLGAAGVFGLVACGSSSGGTGAAPATTIQLGAPSYQTLAPVVTSTTTPSTAVGGASIVAGEQSHEIVSGDYLYGIAKTYCVKAEDIVLFNAWADGLTHALNVGETIKIPPNGCAPGTATQATNAPTVATAVATTTTFDVAIGGTYTVVAGDYLGGIAAKTGTTVDGIVAANGWTDGTAHVIYPGLKIKLPVKTG